MVEIGASKTIKGNALFFRYDGRVVIFLYSSSVMKIAFLDRDGVVNEDYGYVFEVEKFVFTQQFFLACLMLNQVGYQLVIVTNQSGIARGYYAEADFDQLSTWLKQQFASHGLTLDAIYHCPHNADSSCHCRKPKPGMVLEHLARTGAKASDCIMFGDKVSDEQCAQAAGLKRFFMIDINNNPLHFYDTVSAFVRSNG